MALHPEFQTTSKQTKTHLAQNEQHRASDIAINGSKTKRNPQPHNSPPGSHVTHSPDPSTPLHPARDLENAPKLSRSPSSPASPAPRITTTVVEARPRTAPAPSPTMTGKHKPIRLPPLKTLRVHNPKRAPENPCITIMSSVLACWASAGYNAAGCAAIETQLRKCMDGPPPPPAKVNTINYHLSRMQRYLTSQPKKK